MPEFFEDIAYPRLRAEPEARMYEIALAMENLVDGDLENVRFCLKDYYEAMVGYEKLGEMIGRSPEDARHLLAYQAPISAADLLQLVSLAQRREDIHFELQASPGQREVFDEDEDELVSELG